MRRVVLALGLVGILLGPGVSGAEEKEFDRGPIDKGIEALERDEDETFTEHVIKRGSHRHCRCHLDPGRHKSPSGRHGAKHVGVLPSAGRRAEHAALVP
jgi:hypothetical protein